MFETQDQYITIGSDSIFVRRILNQKDTELPTIVLLHDSLGCVELWRDWPLLLAQNTQCDVLVYDRVGYGQSSALEHSKRSVDYLKEQAQYLKQVLVKLKIDKVALFGHSDGGSIALLYAAAFPNCTQAVICEAGHVFVEQITLEGIAQACVAYKETDLKKRLQKYHKNEVDMIFDAWVDTWQSEVYRNWNVVDQLHTITAPVLFMQGTEDEYGSLKQLDDTLDVIKGQKHRIVYPGVGHTPHKEVKDQALQDIVSFLKKYIG